jgi:sugar/nucleoside kinase (ribokinase family)
MKLLKDLLPNVDYFMPSMEEAVYLTGQDDPAKIAQVFLKMGAKACVFKWGERGSYIHTRDEQFRIPAFKVNVSDTTGCGDSYCGGFIAGLVFGRDLRAACELATATSGLVATGLGSDAGVVNLAQVDEFAVKTERLS